MIARRFKVGDILLVLGFAVAVLLALILPDWRLPVPSRQLAPSQYSMLQFKPDDRAYPVPNVAPDIPDVPADGRPATAAFANIHVLTDVTAARFMRLQYAITAWVSPRQGCGFCHAGDDYASDANPRKAAAATMLRMVRHMNADWSAHVAPSGVTCFSCHRGQPVPAETWFPDTARPEHPFVAKEDHWHEDAQTVRGFFPDAGYSLYYLQDTPAHGQSYTALPSGETPSQLVVVRLYEQMMQMADGIGVNCGYCHNSRNFADWGESTPQRWTGMSGLQMLRDINRNYILSVAALVPQTREDPGRPRPPIVPADQSGERQGNGLALCATCHYGRPKPLDGAPLAREFPGLGLGGPGPTEGGT